MELKFHASHKLYTILVILCNCIVIPVEIECTEQDVCTNQVTLKTQQSVVQVTMALSLYYWPSYLLPLVLLIKLVGISVLYQIGHCEHTAVCMFLYSLESTVKRSAPSPQTLHVVLCLIVQSVFQVMTWPVTAAHVWEQSPYSVWRDNRTVV